MTAFAYVLVALALTLPPSLAFAYVWYIRSVTSFNVQEHQRAIEHAKLQREEHVSYTKDIDKRVEQLMADVSSLKDFVREQQKTIDILSDR